MVILCITFVHIASTKFKVVLHGLRFDGLSVLGNNWLIINLKEADLTYEGIETPVTYQTIPWCGSLARVWLARLW